VNAQVLRRLEDEANLRQRQIEYEAYHSLDQIIGLKAAWPVIPPEPAAEPLVPEPIVVDARSALTWGDRVGRLLGRGDR
jgi:hypothetical protein